MILMYHKIDLTTPTIWWVSADAFDRQMADLAAYQVVSLAEYDPLDPSHVVITFDGVYEDVYRCAFPILKKWNYPFELFVIGDHIGGDNAFDTVEPLARFCTVEQLQEMGENGGRIQWHTRTHRKLIGLDDNTIVSELLPPAALKALFPAPHLTWFAYPHGEHDPHAVDVVRANFSGALSCIAGDDRDRYQLNRITAYEDTRFTKTRVSVIVANYNYGRYLPEAIESVLRQTLPPDEILIIDDCSTDNSAEIIKRYSDLARTEINKTNLGIVENFNKAVSLTTGDYVAFLGADNRMRSDYVERCKLALDRETAAAAAYTDMSIFGPLSSQLAAKVGAMRMSESRVDGSEVYLWRFADATPDVLANFEQHNFVHGSSMYRRAAFDAVGGYQKNDGPEDHNLFLRMHRAGWGLTRVSEPLIEYRQHSNAQANTTLNLQNEIGHFRRESQSLQKTVSEQKNHISSLDGELASKSIRIQELQNVETRLRNTEFQLNSALSALNSSAGELDRLKASVSWRVSAPLRYAMTRFPSAARRARQAAKLVYWTVTGQLPQRLRSSIAYRTSPPSVDMAAASSTARVGPASRQVKGPIGAALAKPPTIQTLARRTAKALWWTVTLQLPQRLADRRQALASQTAHKAPKSRVPLEDLKKQAVDIATSDLTDFLNSDARIVFPSHEEPEISVLIVVWNKAYFTLRCLQALHSVSSRIEVILVDNASTDETTDMLSRIDGINVIVSDVNEGFLTATNRAAGVARGHAFLLLNNDAFVRPGAIEAAFATLNEEPNAGAVGGRLILPDGSLQEAGSIVWSDGSTQGYGRGINPDSGEAMFRRDVDYCSGAFLMTPAAVWNKLNGFDTIYAPAYYEEVDYCMRVAEIGLRTIYEPEAVVDHFEFGSENKRGDTLKLVLRNREHFRSRHAFELRKKHLPPSGDNILLARRAAASRARCLLVIDDLVPLASLGSGLPRTKAILRTASDLGWNVVFYPLGRTDIDWSAAWLEIPKNVEIILDGAAGFADFVAARRGYFDTVLVSRPHNMAFVSPHLRGDIAKGSDLRIIYDAEALFALREILRAEVTGKPLLAEEAELMTASELAICDNADAIVCVTEAEASIFRNRFSERHQPPVGVLSFPTEQREGGPEFEARGGFLFIGRLLETASPNWDGLVWFLRECWPHVRLSLPDATLTVVGHVHSAHTQLDAPGVRFMGPLDDLRTAYDAARVFLAPVRFAAGIPIKIVEATAAGVPTVGTRLMARQMNFEPGREIMAEDEPIAFAEAAVALHTDRGAWLSMRDSAQRRIQAEHSAKRFRASLAEILEGGRVDITPEKEATASMPSS